MRTIKRASRWSIAFGVVACAAGLLTCAVGVGSLIVGSSLSK